MTTVLDSFRKDVLDTYLSTRRIACPLCGGPPQELECDHMVRDANDDPGGDAAPWRRFVWCYRCEGGWDEVMLRRGPDAVLGEQRYLLQSLELVRGGELQEQPPQRGRRMRRDGRS